MTTPHKEDAMLIVRLLHYFQRHPLSSDSHDVGTIYYNFREFLGSGNFKHRQYDYSLYMNLASAEFNPILMLFAELHGNLQMRVLKLLLDRETHSIYNNHRLEEQLEDSSHE